MLLAQAIIDDANLPIVPPWFICLREGVETHSKTGAGFRSPLKLPGGSKIENTLLQINRGQAAAAFLQPNHGLWKVILVQGPCQCPQQLDCPYTVIQKF